jgi:hypothetical protein
VCTQAKPSKKLVNTTNLAVSDRRDVSPRDLAAVILGEADLATVVLGVANIPTATHAPAAHPVSNLLLLVLGARCRVVEVAAVIGIGVVAFLPADRRAPCRSDTQVSIEFGIIWYNTLCLYLLVIHSYNSHGPDRTIPKTCETGLLLVACERVML